MMRAAGHARRHRCRSASRRTASAGDRDRLRRAPRRCRTGAGPSAAAAAGAPRCRAGVRAIEYQGNFVKVMLDKIGDDEFDRLCPGADILRDPFSVGDVVIAGWEKDKTRMLA